MDKEKYASIPAPHAPGEPSPGNGNKTLDPCRKFVKSMGQTIKLISLYRTNHPVPASSLQETWRLLQDLFAETEWPEVSLGLAGERWMMNETVIAESAQVYEVLMLVFRTHALTTVTFLPGVKNYELAAFCEMASTQPSRAYDTDAADHMKQRGVKHIRINVEEFVRAKHNKPAIHRVIQSPIPPMQAPPPSSGVPAAGSNGADGKFARMRAAAESGFGSFIKALVDESVQDPKERARIYGETVQMVKHALARHVSEATHNLRMEKQAVLNERMRAENVLANVADGKVVVDKEGRVVMMNPAAEEIAGKQFSDLAGKPILESLGTGEQMIALAKDLVVPEHTMVSEEVQTAGQEDVLSAFRQSMALVQDEHGRFVGTYAVPPYVAKFREAMKIQDEFISKVTHDLKAPLTSICAALELIGDTVRPKISQEESRFLDISLRNSKKLRDMISELLDFSKIRSGQMPVHPAAISIESILQEVVEGIGPWAQSKNIRLEAVGAGRDLPLVLADRPRVVQILNNLVSNAIKSTQEGGSIALSAELGDAERSGKVIVSVKDTGRGIPQEQHQRVFEKFAQLPGDSEYREGVGLGLSIVKELVALHQGEVWFESAVGEGSTFYFSLPVVPASARSKESLGGPAGHFSL